MRCCTDDSGVRYAPTSPARVREQVAQLLEVSGCNYVICSFAWGTFTHEQTLRSLRLFAEEVMPAFSGSAAPVA